MKIAYFSPLSPSSSGIARLTEEFLPYLKKHAEIDIIIDDIHSCLLGSDQNNLYNHLRFPELYREKGYDAIIYNIGNSEYHYYMYQYYYRYRGILFLHENVLHHSIGKYYFDYNYGRGYFAELCQNYPSQLSNVLQIYRYAKHGYGDDRIYMKYPMSDLLIRHAEGVIVMNSYLKESIKARYPDKRVREIKFPYAGDNTDNEGVCKTKPIEDLNLDKNTFVIGIFGMIGDYKRIEPTLRALRHFSDKENYKTVIVGKSTSNIDVNQIIESMNLNNVHYFGYLPYSDMISLINACSIVINIRYPAFGEMSAVLIRNLGMGKAVIIYDTAQFKDIPDNIVVKIKPCLEEESSLINTIRYYYKNREELKNIGNRAKQYIKEHHSFADAAEGIADFCGEIVQNPVINREPDPNLNRLVLLEFEDFINEKIDDLKIPDNRKQHIRSLWRSAY